MINGSTVELFDTFLEVACARADILRRKSSCHIAFTCFFPAELVVFLGLFHANTYLNLLFLWLIFIDEIRVDFLKVSR